MPLHGLSRSNSQPAWRNALILPAFQAAGGVIAATIAILAVDLKAGLGVAAGSLAVAAGFLVFAWRTALRPQAVGPATSFLRLLVGLLLKWTVIAAVLVVAWRSGEVGAGGVLVGVLTAYVAYFFSLAWLLR
jgi:hypothetical protein